MFAIIMAIILLIAGMVTFKTRFTTNEKLRLVPKAVWSVGGTFLVIMGLLSAASTSYVYIDSDETGHLQKIYGSDELVDGKIIAVNGEKGYQAEILRPGFHFSPLLTVINDVEEHPIVTIPAGFYGRIETRDGTALPSGAIMAAEWSDENFNSMLDAEYFLQNGGQKGLQTSVLKPGRYPINLYLYKVVVADGQKATVYDLDGVDTVEANGRDTRQTSIPAGHVGVVTSRIESKPTTECRVEEKTVVDENGLKVRGALSVPLVPIGCRGIWKEALTPGGYFLNRDAYDVTMVNTRVQTWRYDGGYTSRSIDLTVSQDGTITQTAKETVVDVPEGAADSSVSVKVEGWTVFQNLRALVQVTPENAPIVVAAVGGLKEVEDRVLTPAIIAEVRDVLGGQAILPTEQRDGSMLDSLRAVRILDLVENRDHLQSAVDLKVREHGRKAGVNIMEVRFGNPDIPPEMLVARKREQLATQLSKAYATEQQAQVDRQKTEREKALADKQSQIVQKEVDVLKADQRLLEQTKLGQAEKVYLEALALGEKARAEVLGEDRVLMLNITDKILAALMEKPELVNLVGKLVPNTVVTGGGGLEGPMAVLGQALGNNKPKAE